MSVPRPNNPASDPERLSWRWRLEATPEKKQLEAASTGSVTLLFTSRPKQATGEKRKQERKKGLFESNYFLPFDLKHTFLVTCQKRLETQQFLSFKAKQPRICRWRVSETVLPLPDKSQHDLQMSHSPTEPNHMPGLPRQRIVNFIKYVKGEKNQL